MDSLQMYMDICHNNGIFHAGNRLKKVDMLVQCIMDEIMVEPYDINKSPFIKETVKLLKIISSGDYSTATRVAVYPFDVYVVIRVLNEKVRNVNTKATWAESPEYAKNIFRAMQFQGSQQPEMNEVSRFLKEIQCIVDEQRMRVSEGAEYTGSGQQLTQKKTAVEIDSKKSLERSSNCRANVQQWHNETLKIQQKLNEMQPMVGEVLKKMTGFANEITEGYVLQFAKMQIELYNLISDNLFYHANAVRRSNDQNYVNAVANYQEFLDMIVDNLSAFGIEEISSGLGTRFDGSVHEVVDNADFSPKLSSVKDSLRSGFKYKDIIIQKEKIRV